MCKFTSIEIISSNWRCYSAYWVLSAWEKLSSEIINSDSSVDLHVQKHLGSYTYAPKCLNYFQDGIR